MFHSLSLQKFSKSSAKLRESFRAYEATKRTPSEKEQLMQEKARESYQKALAELKKAHAALDVKILELFLRKSYEFLETGDRASPGEKTLHYEASKKLSQEVLELFRDPQLTNRLRKLRELGYLDPLELS